MKRILMCTAATAAAAAGAFLIVRAIAAGRERMKSALARAEQVADSTRVALADVENALRDTRNAL